MEKQKSYKDLLAELLKSEKPVNMADLPYARRLSSPEEIQASIDEATPRLLARAERRHKNLLRLRSKKD